LRRASLSSFTFFSVNPCCSRRHVSFLIAVRNGEQFLEAKLRSVLELDYPRGLMEILALSDGSTDRTDEIARRMAPAGVRLLTLPRAGKSAALTMGMREAAGDSLSSPT
jgi:glycosyltransferase involved in cell wall biosynthesis